MRCDATRLRSAQLNSSHVVLTCNELPFHSYLKFKSVSFFVVVVVIVWNSADAMPSLPLPLTRKCGVSVSDLARKCVWASFVRHSAASLPEEDGQAAGGKQHTGTPSKSPGRLRWRKEACLSENDVDANNFICLQTIRLACCSLPILLSLEFTRNVCRVIHFRCFAWWFPFLCVCVCCVEKCAQYLRLKCVFWQVFRCDRTLSEF